MAFIDFRDRSWHEPPGHVRGYSKYVLSPEDGLSARLDVRTSRYPIGGKVLPHTHEIAEQFYVFLEGSGTVVCGDQTHLVGPDQAVFVTPGVVHSVENTGDGDLVFLVVTSPPEDIPR